MQLYLMQHGDAKPEAEDPERPLSGVGREETQAIANKLSSLGVNPTRIFHSPKLRAKQTAEILASALGAEIEETEGLKPKDDPQIIQEKVSHLTESGSYFFVGHLPNIELVAALLVTDMSEPPIHISRYSAPLCLENPEKVWRIKFYLLPELL